MIICCALLRMFHKFTSLSVMTMYRRTEYPELYGSEHSLYVIKSRLMHQFKFSLIHTNQNCVRGKI
jgi:hypothetical protein